MIFVVLRCAFVGKKLSIELYESESILSLASVTVLNDLPLDILESGSILLFKTK